MGECQREGKESRRKFAAGFTLARIDRTDTAAILWRCGVFSAIPALRGVAQTIAVLRAFGCPARLAWASAAATFLASPVLYWSFRALLAVPGSPVSRGL